MVAKCNQVVANSSETNTPINRMGTCWFGNFTKTRKNKEDESSFLTS
jgi:hypothetical protein